MVKRSTEFNGLNFFFQGTDWGLNMYGVDQGLLDSLYKDPKRYNDLLNKLNTKYHLSNQDSVRTINMLDSIGACSYAALANTIFAQYIDNPQQFQKDFGFPMYVQDSNGNTVLNDAELLVDLYIFTNSKSNGGFIFEESNGNLVINKDYLDHYTVKDPNGNDFTVYTPYLIDQEYVDHITGWDVEKINNYFASKTGNLQFEVTKSISSPNWANLGYDLGKNGKIALDEKDLRSEVQQSMVKGEQVKLTIFPKAKGDIILHGLNGAQDSTFDGGHSMFVTRTDYDGVIVSSWGKEYLISYQDLINSQEYRFDCSELVRIRRRLLIHWAIFCRKE